MTDLCHMVDLKRKGIAMQGVDHKNWVQEDILK